MEPLKNDARILFYVIETSVRPAAEQVAAIARTGYTVQAADVVVEDATGYEAVRRRPRFSRLLKMLREGDSLVVASLDALGRNAAEIRQTVARLAQAGVRLYCAAIGQQELTAETGKQFRDTLAALAVTEREQSRIGSRAGAARAAKSRAQRSRSLSIALKREIAERLAGGASVTELAREYGLPLQLVMRVADSREAARDEPLISVPAHEAPRHTIEAVAMVAGEGDRRR